MNMHATFHILLKNIVVSQRFQRMETVLFVHELSINRTNIRNKLNRKIKTLGCKNEKLLWYYSNLLPE